MTTNNCIICEDVIPIDVDNISVKPCKKCDIYMHHDCFYSNNNSECSNCGKKHIKIKKKKPQYINRKYIAAFFCKSIKWTLYISCIYSIIYTSIYYSKQISAIIKHNNKRITSKCIINSTILTENNEFLAQGIMNCYIRNSHFNVYLYNEEPYNVYRQTIPAHLFTTDISSQERYKNIFDQEHDSKQQYVDCETDPADITNMKIPCNLGTCLTGELKMMNNFTIIFLTIYYSGIIILLVFASYLLIKN